MLYTITGDMLDSFKKVWPAHGLDKLGSVTFWFDHKGDLTDITARDDMGAEFDSAEVDGPALLALSEDAKGLAHSEVPEWWTPWIDGPGMVAEYKAARSGDAWGDCMNWFFAVANELESRGEEAPAEWHFRAGAGGPGQEPGDYAGEICQSATIEGLRYLGARLHRLYGLLKAAGRDY